MSEETPAVGIAWQMRVAAILIVLGVLVEAFTLRWNHPIAFLVFLGIGGLLMFVGIVVYLLSLVSPVETPSAE